MQLNRRFLIPTFLAAIGCAKEPDRVESMVVQPAAAAEQVLEKSLSPVNVATKKEESVLATRAAALTDDGAGKLLSELMTPGSPAFRVPLQQKSLGERPLPANIVRPDPPAAANTLNPARCPAPTPAELRPIALLERVPMDLAPLVVDVPQRIEFTVGILSKLPAADAKQAVPLPTLARRSLDRGSLEDPTTEFTAQSIISNKLPLRSLPAPFVKVDLPNPFENAEAVKVTIIVKEDPLTAVGDPPPPKP
jgi:hypothetical protein